jgi:cell division initiation protein
MRYTPVELRHVKLGRSWRGYTRHEADKLLEDVADSFEDVWRERGELTDKLHEVQKTLDEVKQREALLASTLVSAERAAVEAKEAARREADLIVAEAHGEARSVTRAAQAERERLFAEARRVETLLRAALGMIDESQAGRPDGEQAGSSAPEYWPRREDTREFHPVAVEAEPEGEPEPAQLPPVARTHEEDESLPGRDFAWG